MAIKVKSSLQTEVGMSFNNLILSICGVYQVQKTLAKTQVLYFIDREKIPVKTETLSCDFSENELPARALYNALKLKLQNEGVSLSDIEDV